MNDVAATITSLAALVAASATLASVLVNGRRIKGVSRGIEGVSNGITDVSNEVRTANSQTLAQLADATESRRVGNIAVADRTDVEKSHLVEAGGAYTRAAPRKLDI